MPFVIRCVVRSACFPKKFIPDARMRDESELDQALRCDPNPSPESFSPVHVLAEVKRE